MEHGREGQSSVVEHGWFNKNILNFDNLQRSGTALVLSLGIAAASSPDTQNLFDGHLPNVPEAEAKSTNDVQGEEDDCTSIRDEKDGMYLGHACATTGDTFTMGGSQRFDDAPYGVIYIKKDNVYKCGYINPVLPTGNAPAQAVDFCTQNQYKIDNRRKIYDKINCPEKKTSNTCDGPTFHTRIRKPCTGTKKRVYRNFTPGGKNILNVMGKKVERPFSGVVTSNKDVNHLHFRTKSKYRSENGVTAAVVRSDDVEKRLGWGWFLFNCLQPDQLNTGPRSNN